MGFGARGRRISKMVEMTSPSPPSRGKRAVRAGLWASLQNVAKEGIGFLVFLLLARLFLDDTEFGIVALANSFIMFAQIAGQFGLGTALIRQRDITDAHKTASFWVVLAFAVLLAAILAGLSGLFAHWADEPRVAPVLSVLTIGLVLTFAGSVHAALLQREMNFKALALRSLIGGICGGLAALVTAYLGGGVWSLVALNLVTAGVSTILLWWSMPWRPDLTLSWPALKELLPTGLNVTGIGIVRYIGDMADRLIVGFFIGIADLGLLYVGQRIVKALQTVLTQSINAVALPVFSEIQTDIPQVRNAYRIAVHFCVTATAPLFVGLALVAPEMTSVFLGEKWDRLTTILAVLAIAAAFSAPLYFNQPLLIAIGRAQKALQIATLGTVVQLTCVAIGAFYGLVGVAYGLLARQVIMTFVWLYVLNREIALEPKTLIASIKAPALGLVAMTGLLLALSLPATWPGGLHLAALVLLGSLAYLAVILVLDREAVLQIVRRFKK